MDTEHEVDRLMNSSGDTEQQVEISDIYLSARSISQQIIAEAKEQADEILKAAETRADQIISDAQAKAETLLREAEVSAASHDEKPVFMSPEMQEYVVRHVGDCFAKLNQRQAETTDYINAQWQSFLSGLSLSDSSIGVAPASMPEKQEISRQEIESRVSLIAKELMEIIGS